MPSLSAKSFQRAFEKTFATGGRVDAAAIKGLANAATKIKATDEKQAAQALLALVQHDKLLDADEVEPARKALCQLLGLEPSKLPPALEKLLKNAVPVPNVEVKNYDLTFDFSKDLSAASPSFPARAVITLDKGAPKVTILEVDPDRIVVDEVRAGGKKVAFTCKDGRIHVEGAEGKKTLDISYRVTPDHDVIDGYGLIRDRHSGRMWTMTWPYNTGALFPSNSRPHDGATARVTVHLKADAKDAKNNPIEVVSAGTRRNGSFHVKKDVPAYAVAFTVGAFTDKGHAHDHGHDAVTHGLGTNATPATRKEVREATTEAMTFFSKWLGAYVFKDRMNIVESQTNLGGMEHAGNILLSAGMNREDSIETAVHETAHMWFGDTVRIKNWGQFWMSEGFTNFATYRFMGHKHGDKKMFEMYDRAKDMVRTQIHDKAHALSDKSGTDIHEIFTDIPYQQGPWMLRMIEGKLGKSAFDDVIGGWFKAKKGTAVTTEDFIAFVRDKTGVDFTAFFSAWNHLEALPTFRDGSSIEGKVAHLLLEPHNTKGRGKPPAGIEVPVVLEGAGGKRFKALVTPGKAVDVDAGFPIKSISWDPERFVLCDIKL
ncbi:MAG: M1 family aminopeptidase [Deltaproteobacteria bacterium]|nr:M1 family aminopeptidase [Deltaproteobacteria bacterium]